MTFRFLKICALLAATGLGIALPAQAQPLPIDAFAMAPAIRDAGVSPDGKQLGIIRATSKAGGYILEIYQTGNLKKRPVRIGTDVMEMTGFRWLNTKRVLISFRQNLWDANHNYWAYKSAVVNADASGKWLELPEGAELVSYLHKNPQEILISYDDDDNRIADIKRFNIYNGRTTLVTQGSEKLGGFGADLDGEVREASGFDVASGSIERYARLKGSTKWKLIKTISPLHRETFDILGFDAEQQNQLYILASNGEDKAGIYTLDLETGKMSDRLFGLKSVDVSGILRSRKPDTYGVLTGFSYVTDKNHYYFTDPNEEALYNGISALFPGQNVTLDSRSDDDNAIVVHTSGDHDAGTYYLLRNKRQLELLGAEKPLLTPEKLADVDYIHFTARDGMVIPAYVTKPKGKGPFPAIALPHGGPWARDTGGYDEWAQLLANRGYLVIQPEFRGSEGFGLAHWIAGDKEWGLKMQDDVDDAALYLVKEGLAKRDKLAIFGWSYGGYSAFAGSMRKDNIYQCSVAGAGVSDLSLINAGLAENPYARRLQRPTIKGVSPIEHVNEVDIPLMIVHGDIDHIVDIEHSREFVGKLKDTGKPYKYIELKGADHKSHQLTYEHRVEFYSALVDWFQNTCFK